MYVFVYAFVLVCYSNVTVTDSSSITSIHTDETGSASFNYHHLLQICNTLCEAVVYKNVTYISPFSF